jgi:hypothetical protein
MNDDLTLLASAYLDDDVTADERARVESDPDLLAEVERLRAVRLLLGDVEPAAISMREAQLAAALNVWDRLPDAERSGARRDVTPAGIDAAAIAGAASVSAPTPLRNRRRKSAVRSTRWLTGAAAALVLVLAGGVALQLGQSSDDDSSSAEGDNAATEALVGGDQAPQEAAADTLAAPAEADEELSTQLDTGVADPPPPGEVAGLVQLENTTDLADFAGAALGAPRSPDDVPAATSAPNEADGSQAESSIADAGLPVCLGVDVIVGPAVYIDEPVVVGIDEGRNLAIAYRAETCTAVAQVRLP